MVRSTPSAAPSRGPGRPARLSRDAIVSGALDLLDRTPDNPLTVGRIANEVGAVPAALYRHFADLDELLDEVLGRVLGGVELAIRRRAAWPEQVRDWMTSVRSHLLRYPAALRIIGRRGRTSPSWLDAVASLVEVLERGGLSGARLARAHLWVTEVTMGLVMQEASLSLPDQIAGAHASLSEMSDAGRARLAPLMPQLRWLGSDAFFSYAAERTVAALLDVAGAAPRISPAPTAARGPRRRVSRRS
jgi:AcrR family transcriptional regulator